MQPALGIRSARNLPAPHPDELAVGARVVAKWPSDSHYYIGRVVGKTTTIDKYATRRDTIRFICVTIFLLRCYYYNVCHVQTLKVVSALSHGELIHQQSP